ncbi:hypothetical protein B7P43_G16610 [Cryptotermes secundus]|uniref:Uncharacterized protein n=1 Tax=Cryptotermes secundus TaxID=105785 RepID=A0A2J7QCX2_9NEOP|nr:hypothetical protein B7P43_G16610 [Cryptotermes secundus]
MKNMPEWNTAKTCYDKKLPISPCFSSEQTEYKSSPSTVACISVRSLQKYYSFSISEHITMGQGTSRLNWACSCEDGKFNLSATYEEQKFSPTETIVEEHQQTQTPQVIKTQLINCQKTSTSKDTLLPIMDVESSTDEPNKNTKLRRTFSSCDLVYTKPTGDSRRQISSKSGGVPKNSSQQYGSQEALSSGGNSSTNTESSGQWHLKQ